MCILPSILVDQQWDNEVEYEVVPSGLNLAKATGAVSVAIHYDSQVVVGLMNNDYKTTEERMIGYLSMIK